MKRMKFWIIAVAMVCCGIGGMTSCHGNGKADAEKQAGDSVESKYDVKEVARLKAISSFLVDTIGKQYAPGELCIPCVQIVGMDQKDPSAVLVWGGFWVYHYKVVGDTLKTVSGGSHPGLMCLQPLDNGYLVTGFEQVGDGSKFLPSAKRIFGDKLEAFQTINSDEKKREETRAAQIADYVEANNLPVKYYQDYGWPAQKIPVEKN